MWIFGTFGFISAVEHRDNHDLVMVRARDRKSLDMMIESIELAGNAINQNGEKLAIEKDLEPKASSNSDYRWRVTISKATFALFTQFEILNYLNYPNFKSALGKFRGPEFTKAAHGVWDEMLGVSDGPQYYNGVTTGGKKIASKYAGYGSYSGGGWGNTTGYSDNKTWQGSKYPAAGAVGSTFFSNDPEWQAGVHGFNDNDIEDADIIETYKLDGGEDIPEVPEGAENWSVEEFEEWMETGRKPGDPEGGADVEGGVPMALEEMTDDERLTYDQAKAELTALTAAEKPTQSKYAAKKAAADAEK